MEATSIFGIGLDHMQAGDGRIVLLVERVQRQIQRNGQLTDQSVDDAETVTQVEARKDVQGRVANVRWRPNHTIRRQCFL